MAKIGCCHAFKKCSDAGRCIQVDSPNYEEFFMECYYNDNLEMGKNFYTEYNENNKARAEEYKRKQENLLSDKSEQPEVEILQVDNTSSSSIDDDNIYERFKNRYMNAYIDIDSRQFFLGTRGGYHNLTYPLGNDGVDKLFLDLKDVEIYFDTDYLESKYYDEYGTEEDRADWRVVVTIADTDYHLLNSDTRSLRKETALSVAEYFSSFGYKVSCECIGNSKQNFTIANKVNEVKSKVEKPIVIEKEHIEDSSSVTTQISLFDF